MREGEEQIHRAAKQLDKVDGAETAIEQIKADLQADGDPADRRLDQGAHEAYVVPAGFRGIQETVVGPGKYYVNTLAVTPIIIPTTNMTVEWTAENMSKSFDPFAVISKDGFTMQLEFGSSFASNRKTHRLWSPRSGALKNLIKT
ncbi:MAG: hypothetical protein IPK58_25260 [Acidobacteria bacterium]|nr:hypothetical protein [Acidobacteriota bacterium]